MNDFIYSISDLASNPTKSPHISRSGRVRRMSKILSLALIVSLTACFYGHPMMGVTPAEDDSAFDYSNLLLLLVGARETLSVSVSAAQVLIFENVTFTASGGVAPYSYRVSQGGGTISSTGVYTAAAVLGTTTITATDSRGVTGTGVVSVSGGLGNGTFINGGMSADYAANNQPLEVSSGDFTSDGILDIVVGTNAGSTIRVFTGFGDGTFVTIGTLVAFGNSVRQMAVVDINSDGNLDVVGGSAGSQFSVLPGNADVTFMTRADYATPAAADGLGVGDFDNDGVLDVVTGNTTAGTLSFFKGNSDGTFQTVSTFGSLNSPRRLAVGDFNNDGNLDFAAVNQAGAPSTNSGVTVYPGNGNGTFQTGTEYNSNSTDARYIVLGDFNGDSRIDIVTSNESSSNISVLFGNGDGTFQAGAVHALTGLPRDLAACDFNGDGLMDLAVANNSANVVDVLFGNGAGGFPSGTQLSAGGAPTGMHCRDLNGDSKMDVAMTSVNAQTLRVYIAN